MKTSEDRRNEARRKKSWIGFDSSMFKSEKFDKKIHLPLCREGIFVRYRYGASEKKKEQLPIIGKILSKDWRGLGIYCDLGGFHFATWKRIDRIYMPKKKRKKVFA